MLLSGTVLERISSSSSVPHSPNTFAPPNTAIEHGHLTLPWGQIYVQIVNPDAKGTPLLVLHGGPGMASYYCEPLAALATDRPVIFYDQFGCGRSTIPETTERYNVSAFVEEFSMLRTALGLEEIH